MSSENTEKKRQGAPRIPRHVLKAIDAVVSYLWNDEFADYTSRTREDRDGHVFRDLLKVRRFLKKNDVTKNKQVNA